MKKSTFLLFVLLVAIYANGQQPQNLQQKIKEMQATFARFTMQTKHFSKMNFPLKPGMQKNSLLKNALALQKLDSVIYQNYIVESETWHNQSKDEYLYNSELNNTAWIEYDWNVTGNTWQDTAKVELEYNSESRVNVMNIYSKDDTSGEFVLDVRSEAYYNPEGRLDSIIHFVVVSENTLEEEGRQVYHYNETGQLVQMDFTTIVEDEEGEYLQSMRIVYTYTNEGNMDTFSWYFADPEGDFLYSKTTYFYDESNKLIASEDSTIGYVTSLFEPSLRTDIEYNAEGDVSTETFSFWYPEAEAYITEIKNEYTYTTTSLSEVIFPSYLQFWGPVEESISYSHAVAEVVTHYNMAGGWVPTERSLFYYSEGTATGTRELLEAQVLVYPNPATDNITLTWNNYRQLMFEVYHMTGAKIIEKQVSSGMTVPVSNLTDGIYLFKLKKENQTVYSGKLIKK